MRIRLSNHAGRSAHSRAIKRERNLTKVGPILHPSQVSRKSATLGPMNSNESRRIEAFISHMEYPRNPAFMIACMEDVQAEFGCVSVQAQRVLAEFLGVEVGRLEILLARCSDAFSLRPADEQAVVVCHGPVCQAHGAKELCHALTEQGVGFELHACLGACDRPPAARCGEKVIAPANAALINKQG